MRQFINKSFYTARVIVYSEYCVLKLLQNSFESWLILLYLPFVDLEIDFITW